MIGIRNTGKWEIDGLAGATSFQIWLYCLPNYRLIKNYTAIHLILPMEIVLPSLKPLCGGMGSSI